MARTKRQNPMNGREVILGRIREALKAPAPAPGHQNTPGAPPSTNGHHSAQEWLPAVGPDHADRVELFRKNSEALKTVFEVVGSTAAAAARIAEMARADAWKTVGVHADDLVENCVSALEGVTFLKTDGGYGKSALAACDVGITSCECLVAQTGSVLVSSLANGGRALSVLPPHHIVIATADQLLPDLSAALTAASEKYHGRFPSSLSFITGPSRTGDIERILVLGAHGPKKLTVFLVDSRK
jgi:L-lactate dehydrogenase complex protein LldG